MDYRDSALCEKCWNEEHLETPCSWDPNFPRWCNRHLAAFLATDPTWRAGTGTRQRVKGKPPRLAGKQVVLILIACSMLLATLAACGLTTVASSPTVTVSCAPAVTQRPHLFIQYDRQTLDYPDTLGHQADVLVASWL